jgi:hypothetical protein
MLQVDLKVEKIFVEKIQAVSENIDFILNEKEEQLEQFKVSNFILNSFVFHFPLRLKFS